MSKKLGYFIINCESNEQFHSEYILLQKKINEGYFDETISNPQGSFFSHIFVQDITIAKFKETGQPYMKLNLYVDFGDRYTKNDIIHFTFLIERILKRDISFKTSDERVKSFFENTPVLY